jgi:hypothetical protein
VTIFGIQHDRIVQVGSTWSTPAARAETSIRLSGARPRLPGCLRQPEGAGGCLGRRHGLPTEIPVRNYAVETAARPVETGLAYDLPRDSGRGMLA